MKTKLLACMTLGVVASSYANAADFDIKGLSVHGRVKQSYMHLYDLEDGSDEGPMHYLAEINASYRPNSQITLTGNLWYRGMWNDPDWVEPEGGLKNLYAGPPFPSGSFQHGTSNCNLAAREFCAKNDEVDKFDNFNDDMIRELAIKYRDKKRRYSIKAGKFQRGWGQSDGLRLLDILHAQELRDRFVYKDSDETRLPAWMVSMDFDLGRMGLDEPFEALGMERPTFELNIIPEIRHSRVVVNNPTPGVGTDGGMFGLPWPDLVDMGFPHQSGLGAAGFGGRLIDKEKDDFEFDDPEVGARLKFRALGGEMTLNAFYGYQDLPVMNLGDGVVHVGSGVNDAASSLVNVPVDHQTLLAAIWLPNLAQPGQPAATGVPSGYIPYLRGAAGKGPLTVSPLTALTEGVCNDPVNDPTNLAGGVECSVTADILFDYTHRQKVIGFSFARDMSDKLKFGPKNTGPTIRTEFSYEFDKPFNRLVVENPFVPDQLEMGAVANLVSPSVSVVKRDVTSLMIGFDYPLWIPGWESQNKSVFTSFQLFNIHTEDSKDLMAQGPYGLVEVAENQNYMTFLWDMKLDHERITLEGLLITDFDNDGVSYRQRIDFNYFGDNFRPRIEVMHFSGDKESAPIGIFDDKDYIELSLTYQF